MHDLAEQLPESVARAFQSRLYLLATVEHVTFSASTDMDDFGPMSAHETWAVFDEQGHVWGMIPDLVWQGWYGGDIPSVMGIHTVPIMLPPGCYQLSNGKPVTGRSVTATVRVVGCLVTLTGAVTAHRLTDALDHTPMKEHVTATFPLNASGTKLPVATVHSEIELKEALASHQEMVQIATRVRLPRIQFHNTYWPPSQRTANTIAELVYAYEAGEAPDPHNLTLAELEGEDLSVVFEPIMKSHPAAPLFARPDDQSGKGSA